MVKPGLQNELRKIRFLIHNYKLCARRKAHVAITEFTKEGKHGKGGKENSSVQVLLLLIQHGANGLNLLEAQHVVLVEPLLNPAAEAQAISRVHRIGQQNKTLVHRFIVRIFHEISARK